MKKLFIIMFALMLVVGAIVLASCSNNTETTAAPVETTAAPVETTAAPVVTTEATTTEEVVTTEATTEETTEETTTEEETTVATLAEAVYDVDFVGGKAVAKNNNMTCEIKGTATVVNTSVVHGGKTYTVHALNIKNTGDGVVCIYDDLKTENDVKQFFNNDFTAEVFYVNKAKSAAVQASFCQTQQAGWGLAELASDKGKAPYFIIHVGGAYKQVNANTGKASDTELTHVLGVYNKTEGEIAIYINGEFAGSTPVSGDFKAISSQYTASYRSIVIGADYSDKGTLSEFNMTKFVCVDAKIYDYALNDEQAKTAYELAVAALGE